MSGSAPIGQVVAVQNGRMQYLPSGKVDVLVPHFENAFSSLANLIPLQSGLKGPEKLRKAPKNRTLTFKSCDRE
jgi:hypothetical protein